MICECTRYDMVPTQPGATLSEKQRAREQTTANNYYNNNN